MPVLSMARDRHEAPVRVLGGPITIGLVNNMPDGALRTTERQFEELLTAASGALPVRLRFFALPGVPRGDAGRTYVQQRYEPVEALWGSRLDGLIVTGTEPCAPALPDEPYWPALSTLVDWARDHTGSAVWSCLAAHAAVLHTDGIARHRLPAKLSGVFDCVPAAPHALLLGMPMGWRVPHSRYNDLPEFALVAKGYRILSRSAEAGVDAFAKRYGNVSIFFQGHPEYDAGALLREYRRDIGRYLAGERDGYPDMPRGCFDAGTAAAFAAFRERAQAVRRPDLLAELPDPAAAGTLVHAWRPAAVRLYANWLSFLVRERSRGVSPQRARLAAGMLGALHRPSGRSGL